MVPGPGPAFSLAPSALLRTKLAPGPAKARRTSGKSAGIYTVAGVAGSTPSLTQPLTGGYPSTEAWDNIHGGGLGSSEVSKILTSNIMMSYYIASSYTYSDLEVWTAHLLAATLASKMYGAALQMDRPDSTCIRLA